MAYDYKICDTIEIIIEERVMNSIQRSVGRLHSEHPLAIKATQNGKCQVLRNPASQTND